MSDVWCLMSDLQIIAGENIVLFFRALFSLHLVARADIKAKWL